MEGNSEKKRVRAAIIGVGTMGKKYAQMICGGETADIKLSCAVCRNLGARQAISSLGDKIKIYESADELFSNPDEFDAVIIATPHRSHPQLAKQAFAFKKHVLCDKPAGISVKDAKEMDKAAKESGKVYAMMFHQRLYPKYIKIKELIKSGEIGDLNRIMMINSRYLRTSFYHSSGSWRSSLEGEGGGALINQGQHILDIWQWLFGMPEKIYADVVFGKYNDFMVDDEATIQMRYKNNLTGVFMLTTGEAVWEERLEIVGSKGKIILEDDTLDLYRFSEDCKRYIKTAQVNSRGNLNITKETITFDKTTEPYVEMLNNFAQAVILNDSSILIAKGENAVNPLMLTNGAYLSAWKGEAVSLPVNAQEYDDMLLKHIELEKERKR